MAIKKLNREPLENMILEYLERSKHALEAFTSIDYFLAGADETWRIAANKIKYMPNYKLIGICKNITDELNGKINFDSYYEVFNYKLAQQRTDLKGE